MNVRSAQSSESGTASTHRCAGQRRRANAAPLLMGALAVAFLLVGCDPPGKPDPAKRPVRPEDVLDFKDLYAQNCAGCHGADGNLGPAPPLNDKLYLGLVQETDLHMTITDGRAGTLMPAFAVENGGALTAQQVQALVDGIDKNWGPGEAPADAPPILPGIVRMSGSAAEGLKVFGSACAGCHGDKGQGGSFNKKPIGAINDRAFLGLLSERALRRLIITGRPDLGMPAYNDSTGRGKDFKPLTAKDVADLLALLASWQKSTGAE